MHNFTPQNSFIGGLIIGFAVLLFFYTTRRLAGISGIFANAFISKDKKTSNWLFLIGLILGPLLITSTSTSKIDFIVTDSVILISIAGFLVGLGTRIGGGCTSGQGICGISRFSIRSILGTLIFIITAVLTVFILQQYGFYL